MQIIQTSQYAEAFLNEIAIGLETDSYSWEGWHALHVLPVQNPQDSLSEEQQFYMAKALREHMPFEEGTILCLSDGNLLTFYRNPLEDFSMLPVLEAMTQHVGAAYPQLTCHAYKMREESELVVKFAKQHLGELSRMKEPQEPNDQLTKMLLPNAGDFLGNWMAVCEGREGRETPHILVIDDDPLARRIACNVLGDEYPISTAQNAAEGIEKHLLLVPDIVFLDIGLPDADGFMVLEHIRSYDPQCTVVMFSGNSFLDNRVRALSSGAGGFVAKPFSKNAFDHYIEDWKIVHMH